MEGPLAPECVVRPCSTSASTNGLGAPSSLDIELLSFCSDPLLALDIVRLIGASAMASANPPALSYPSARRRVLSVRNARLVGSVSCSLSLLFLFEFHGTQHVNSC